MAPTKTLRNDLSPLDGVDIIVRWMLNMKFLTPRVINSGGVQTFEGGALIESSQTTTSLLSYGKGEVNEYVKRFVDGKGIPQSFTSTNQLTLSFEDEEDLIYEIM